MTRLLPLLVLSAIASCKRAPGEDAPGAMASSGAPIPAPSFPPLPPKGMLWIPPGSLIAGTPEGVLPRVADAELPGVQVVLKGFFIDEFPYPNEAGAIPRSGVTQAEAQALCEADGKRLCSELEWERACKGPHNTTYPYGNVYREAACGTGVVLPAVAPSGLDVHCKSGFGVRDTHGTVLEWTSSPWGRGRQENLVALRGGNGEAGEVIGRCANATPDKPTDRQLGIGFRCCKGEPNLAEVSLDVVRGTAQLRSLGVDGKLLAQLRGHEPEGLRAELGRAGGASFEPHHMWRWRPIGNEELVLVTGCARPPAPAPARCGVAVMRPVGEALDPVTFASTSRWIPTVIESGDAKVLYVMGGDELGAYHRRVAYQAGRVLVSEAEYKAIQKKRKKQRR